MTDDLLALRAILLSATPADHDLFRHAASSAQVPIELVTAKQAAAACVAIADGADLLFIDGARPGSEIAEVTAAARAVARPPFVILLAAGGAAGKPETADAVAAKPARFDDAKRLIERSTRARIPSRALVVDDSSSMRSMVRKVLGATRFPFEVTEASEGFAALKLVGETEFDVVFLDYNMPGFSGLETLIAFKRVVKQAMTVVMITSVQDDSLPGRVRAQGAAFLKKPFFPADVEGVLTEYYGLTALNPART